MINSISGFVWVLVMLFFMNQHKGTLLTDMPTNSIILICTCAICSTIYFATPKK